MYKLSIWILEDYGTNNKWTLKHTISLHKLFGKTKKQMGYFDFESCYTAVIVHPKWNLVFFVGVRVERAVITYNMDSRKKFMSSLHITFRMVDVIFYQKSLGDLTIFPMFPCSQSWSH
jgi:hypothetical protein